MSERSIPDPAIILLKGSAREVNAVAISPDCSLIATGGDDWFVRLFDSKTGVQHRQKLTGHTSAIYPKKHYLFSGDMDGSLRVWDLSGKEKCRSLQGHEDTVRWIACTPDGAYVATSGYRDQTVRLWDCSKLTQVGCLFLQGSGGTNGIAISPDGNTLVVSCASGELCQVPLKTFDLEHAKRVSVSTNRWLVPVSFTPDGKLLLTAGKQDVLYFLDAKTMEKQGKGVEIESSGGLLSIVVSQDSRIAVVGGHGEQLAFVDIASRTILRRIEGFQIPIWSLCATKDCRCLCVNTNNQSRESPNTASVLDFGTANFGLVPMNPFDIPFSEWPEV